MGRLTEALYSRDYYRKGRNSITQRRAAQNDKIQEQIQAITEKFNQFLKKYNVAIEQKTMLKTAGRSVIKTLRQKADIIKDTGNLKKSAGFIGTRSRVSVLAGFNYWKGGRHMHLVEYGFVAKNGEYVPGYNLVKNTYEETKEPVLKALIQEFTKTTDKILRDVGER